MIQWCRYVPHGLVADYERLGWLAKPTPGWHSQYGTVMVWLCACPMCEPI